MVGSKEYFADQRMKEIDEDLNRYKSSFSKNQTLVNIFSELQDKFRNVSIVADAENGFDWNEIESTIDEMLEEDNELSNIVINMDIRRKRHIKTGVINVKIR